MIEAVDVVRKLYAALMIGRKLPTVRPRAFQARAAPAVGGEDGAPGRCAGGPC
jgi:hypothetical protein